MLGLVLIYFIGKEFYNLAEQFGKSQWLFAVLGVLSYYLGTFIGGIVLYLGLDVFGGKPIEEINDLFINLLAFPFGAFACWLFYYLLKKNWSKPASIEITESDILDDNMMR